MDVSEVAVVGLGTMGAGIAEVFARAGLAVVAIEVDPGALERGLATLDRSLARAVTRGKLTEPEKADILGRVRPATGFAAAAGADLAVEVVPERMEIKQQVFAELDRVCRPDTILVTNTSSLSVTAIAAGTAAPARVAGLHFFNPAPVMRLVEVITTARTAPGTGQAVTDLVRRLGKTPVRVPDRADSSLVRCCCPTSTTRRDCWKPATPAGRTSMPPPRPGSGCRWARWPCST